MSIIKSEIATDNIFVTALTDTVNNSVIFEIICPDIHTPIVKDMQSINNKLIESREKGIDLRMLKSGTSKSVQSLILELSNNLDE